MKWIGSEAEGRTSGEAEKEGEEKEGLEVGEADGRKRGRMGERTAGRGRGYPYR